VCSFDHQRETPIIFLLNKMAIKVYISGNSGNKEIVTHQQRIFMILNSLAIECEAVDIAGPGMDEAKDYMRDKGKKKDGTWGNWKEQT